MEAWFNVWSVDIARALRICEERQVELGAIRDLIRLLGYDGKAVAKVRNAGFFFLSGEVLS